MAVAVLVWQDPRDVGHGCGLDQFALLVSRRGDRHGDDKDLLAAERLNEGCLVVVVDFLHLQPGWQGAGAVGASDRGDLVLSGLEQSLRDEFADSAACLDKKDGKLLICVQE